MSIAEDIKNLVANFKDEKVQKNLSEMSLDEIAIVWSDIHAAHDAPAENKEAQEKDFKERNDTLHKIVTPEKLQAQINEYMEGLANGNYSPADFARISEFCTSFSDEFKNDAIKNTLNEMKKRIEEKRLEVENPLTIVNEKLAANLNIQDLDSVIIEGDKEKISALKDKTLASGKTVSFKGPEDKDLGKVSFDELGNADITFVNENNEPQHYKISADGKLTYLPEGQEPQTWMPDEIKGNQQGLPKEAKQALQLAGAAKKVWNGYQKGELDNSVEKSIIVKEGGNSTRIDQGKEAPKDKGPTKVDEGHEDEEDPLAPTKINEDQTPQKGSEASVDSGTKNEKPTPEDELYWKEEDIIKAMFEEWFLKAANAVTNWIVHQIEYAAAGIWNEFEAALNQRKKQLKEKEEEDKKNNKTKDVYGKVRKASEKQMIPLANASKKKAQKETIEAVKAGNVDEVIANNKLLKSLENYTDPKALLTQGTPETTVPFVMGMATMAAKFSDDYAQASILNAQMNNPDAFKGQDIGQVYADKLKEAQLILKHQMLAYREEHPNEDPAKAMFASIEHCTEDMKKAKEIAIEDYNADHYVENGKNPHKNEILEQYENIATQYKANEDQNEGTPRPTPEDEHGHEGDEPPSPQPKDEHGHEGEETPSPQPKDEHGHEDEETPSPQPKDEHGHDNDEPISLPEEANRQVDIDSKIEYIKSGLQMENADLEGREQDVIRRQQNLQKTKDFILGGLGAKDSKPKEAEQWHAPLLPEQKKPAPEFRIPMKPQGRE